MLEKSTKSYPWTTVLWAWLLVGTLDISGATTNYWIGGGREPVNILVYIASGVLGQKSFEAGTAYAWLGLCLHYLIAFIWTSFFFLIYPRIKFLSNNWIVTGFLYGTFIWTIMNRVVVPLSLTPKGPFKLTSAIINCLILIAMIGLPLAFIARRRGIANAN